MDASTRPDDEAPLVGYRAIAEFATSEGFRVSHSTIQKYCSPAVNTGPEITGFWGPLATSTKGLVRAWIKSRHRSDRPVSKRWGDKSQEIVTA
jgi:hypothetical protein